MNRLIVPLLTVLLSACAVTSLRPGASEAEVMGAMGRPALEFEGPEGSRQLAYPTGPFGEQTYMAHIGRDGRLQRLEQVLDDSRINEIRQGMSADEVLRLIGPPYQRVRFGNLAQTAWDYRFRDTWGYLSILSVMVDDAGRVASRITRRIEPRDRTF
ncbi:MAG TPA: hypothetical protein VEC19_05750 [Usitatibacter sp.]|nr:hypothetical protein [Usitatibacter sp.]